MALLELRDVGHRYPSKNSDDQWALNPLDLTFVGGRTYAVVGPSGCGKTTLLNILSGLVAPTQGTVSFDGVDVTAQPTRQRNIAQVFQFPVIYQSMSVRENLAFPLECRGWRPEQITKRVETIAEALGLAGQLDSRARSLQADQKQLISLGRGLVRDDVAAILMDEPLTVIDPQQKLALRRKIRELSQESSPTVIYVTHDQYEAMTFAQEILVMNHGEVIQQGTPEQLFESPSTTYVGYFVGSPSMNFLDVQVQGDQVRIGDQPVSLAWTPEAVGTGRWQVGIRPEYVTLADQPGRNVIDATLTVVRDQGATRVCRAEVAGQQLDIKIDRSVGVPPLGPIRLTLPRAKLLPYLDGQLAVIR